MGSTNIFFQGNLKYLRERKKLTQAQLAEVLGLTRVRLNALESGHTRSPLPEDYINISNYFRIAIDTLMKVDLPKLGEVRMRQLESGDDVYFSRHRVLAITVDRDNSENVEFVPIKAKAGYLAGFSDPDYIAALPKFSLPGIPADGTYRGFPISGDSMLPVTDGSYIIARYVTDWREIKAGTDCIVISGQQDLVFKRLTIEGSSLLLQSLNPSYAPYRVEMDEVHEIWSFFGVISFEMPEPADLAYISKAVSEIRSHLMGRP